MGIGAFARAETAQRRGGELIVTDHHLPGPNGVPNALGVVNPNQAGCAYPYKQLCGARVAFKVAQGLMQRRLEAKDHTRLLLSFMKVVAIATIADAVPLTGENRVFASLGLEALRKAVNPGLKALLEVAQISTKRPPTSTEVAFRIAPRINAAGRMDVARDVIELFSVKDPARSRELAVKLDHLNTDRQEEERRILRAVEERFSGDPTLCDSYCIVVDGEGSHRGVIGITATPAAFLCRAGVTGPTLAAALCPQRMFPICAPIWMPSPAPGLLWLTSTPGWISMPSCRSMKLRPRCFRPCICSIPTE